VLWLTYRAARCLHRNDVAVTGSDVGNDQAPGHAVAHRGGLPFLGLALVGHCDLGLIAREGAALGRYYRNQFREEQFPW
jgi:hypothetical protein